MIIKGNSSSKLTYSIMGQKYETLTFDNLSSKHIIILKKKLIIYDI